LCPFTDQKQGDNSSPVHPNQQGEAMKNYEQDPQVRSGGSPEIRGNVVKPDRREQLAPHIGRLAVKGGQGKG